MRTFLVILLLCAALTMKAAAQSQLNHPPKPPPRHGMTMAEVLARYGEPRHRALLDGAPIWYYRLKFNEVYGRELVPFEFSSENVYPGEIIFNAAGRVARVSWFHSSSEY